MNPVTANEQKIVLFPTCEEQTTPFQSTGILLQIKKSNKERTNIKYPGGPLTDAACYKSRTVTADREAVTLYI